MTPSFHSDDVPWDALTRYVAGELPAPDVERLQRWIAADPSRETLVGEFRQIWLEARGLRQPWDAKAALERVKRAPAGPAHVINLPRFYRGGSSSPWRRAGDMMLRVAAVLVVSVGGAGLWWMLSRAHRASADDSAAVSQVSTPRGQRASLNLPDGTHVLLGPASAIRYAVARDRGPRTIQLEGNAFFDVTHDTTRPFTVRTAYGVATDVGTRFDVRAYPADSVLAVAVAEGAVALPGGTTLRRGQVGRVDPAGKITVRADVDLSDYLAWTEGHLEFHDVPLREAIIQLGRWYDLDIRLADSAIGGRRLTASFRDEAAPEMLRLVTASLRLGVERHGRAVTLAALR